MEYFVLIAFNYQSIIKMTIFNDDCKKQIYSFYFIFWYLYSFAIQGVTIFSNSLKIKRYIFSSFNFLKNKKNYKKRKKQYIRLYSDKQIKWNLRAILKSTPLNFQNLFDK